VGLRGREASSKGGRWEGREGREDIPYCWNPEGRKKIEGLKKRERKGRTNRHFWFLAREGERNRPGKKNGKGGKKRGKKAVNLTVLI